MRILAGPRTGRKARPRFRAPPWHDRHPQRCALEHCLAPDHLARVLDQAVARLDLSTLRARYGGTGSAAHPPELLLRAVLYELRRGRHRPADWHRDARECAPVRWLLRGAVVARSCWYSFRDRVGPRLLELNAQVLAQALDARLTPATRAAGDGTSVAANASRHKLVHQAALARRLEQLAGAVADDARPAAAAAAAPPAAAAPAWLAGTVRGRRQQLQRGQRAHERLQELHAANGRKWASKRKPAKDIVVRPADPEAAVGRDKEKGFRPLYNVQVFDDLDSPLILG